ncbi:hypothetical protein [Piscirickettsia litoralis]|nr:hypothetical protein [Piscirickettsia litoralis]
MKRSKLTASQIVAMLNEELCHSDFSQRMGRIIIISHYDIS